MKKTIALLLVLVMCLSLVACGSNGTTETKGNEAINTTTESQKATTEATEPELDILGEWVSVKDNSYTITFQDDGTCFYTGTPPTNTVTGSFAIDATITWNGTVSSTETTTPPETTAPEEKVSTYKYTFDSALSIITIYTSTTTNYEVVVENGKVVIATVDGEYGFVRAEDYEEYHAAYLEKFYATAKEGRTELEFGKAYTIQDGLNLVVNECVTGENTIYQSVLGNQLANVYLSVVFENASNQGIFIREMAKLGNDGTVTAMRTDVNISVEMNGNPMLTMYSTDGGVGYFCKAIDEGFFAVNDSSKKIYLEPGESCECYILIASSINIETVKQTPNYSTITFDNYNFFCDLSALVQNFE